MAVVNRDDIKGYFNTDDIPTETQYHASWDSFVHVNDYRRELTAPLNFDIPINHNLEKMFVVANATGIFKIGTTPGGEEILPERNVTSGQLYVFKLGGVDTWANTAAKTIYVSGVACDLYVEEKPVKPFALSA